jgi:hypothetical protein
MDYSRARVSKDSLDTSAPRANGAILRVTVSECSPYDIDGGWLREFNRACDRFLVSRGLDPSEGQWDSVNEFFSGKNGPAKKLVDKSHTT